MLEHWYALDPGSHWFRIYDYKKEREVSLRSCIAKQDKKVMAIGADSFSYVYLKDRAVQVKYPLQQGRILSSVKPLVQAGLKQLQASQSLFRPCIVVVLSKMCSSADKNEWQKELLEAGVRKVEFVSVTDMLQTEKPCFIIHAGHSCTEMGIYAYGQEFVYKSIHFAGRSMDEKIQKIIAQQTRCLISQEDARALKEATSEAFWKKKNVQLQCHAMDRFQDIQTLMVKASDLWPAMEDVEKQIVLWAKSCFQVLGVEMKERIMRSGILLSGGLANCFGLKQALEYELGCPVICTNHPECDMIDSMKGWK